MSKNNTIFKDEIIDELIKSCDKPQDLLSGSDGFRQLQKAIIERILNAEITTELGYEKKDPIGNNSGNSRNGHSQKSLKTSHGTISIDVPRDRNSEYAPQLIKKHQTRFEGFDDKILSLYARGMSTRDIQAQLVDLYGVEVSPALISQATNEIIEEVKLWQARPIDKIYPIVYLDAIMIKIKEEKSIINKAFYLAIGINLEGQKELLGIWISQNEGAKFWLAVLTELKNRGLEDILIACVDGLVGFPEAIETVFPNTQVQLCIVHMIRNSLKYVSWKYKKEVAKDLKQIYKATTAEEAEINLNIFADKWDKKYPCISKSWKSKWENIIPFFAYPAEVRRTIYTTNAIESINMCIRKVIKTKRMFPSDEAALKLLYLALKNIAKKWTMPIKNWQEAMNCFLIMFEDRLTKSML
jgi:transposase-like protein